MSKPLPTPRAFLTKLFRSLASIRAGDDAQDVGSANPLRALAAKDKQLFLALHVLFPNELLPALDLLDRGLVTRFVVRGGSVDGDAGSKEDLLDEKEAERAGMQEEAQEEGRVEEDPLNSTHAQEDHAGRPSSNDTNAVTMNPRLQVPPPLTMTTNTTQTPQHGDHHAFHKVRSAQPPPTYHNRSRSRYASASDTYSTTTSYEVRLHAWNCSCPAFAFSAFPATTDDAASDFNTQSAEITGDAHNYSADGEEEWTFGGLTLGDGSAPACKHLLACLLAEKCGLFHRFVEEKVIGRGEAAGWAAGWEA